MNASARTRIKICGITRLEDASAVVSAGADALGLVFAAASPRRVDVATAARIAGAVSGRLTRVGLFVDPEPEEVAAVLERVELDLLQFHGAETDAFCAAFGVPYMKAHRVRSPVDARALARDYPTACCHLLDAYVPGRAGGTGRTFDWQNWPDTIGLRLVLAGGLTPENVDAAMARTRPFAVDVSGGVEGPRKGIKDPSRIARFVAAVRQADRAAAAT